jgi:ppGpp synthetase/RelA/SpoT-type nucleotidyltranferase
MLFQVKCLDCAAEWADHEENMDDASEFPRFAYSNGDVRRAGELIAGDLPWTDESAPTIRDAFRIANSWRDSHAYPMRSVRQSAIHFIGRCQLEGITAARLKRMQAIRRKLRRINIRLNRLQDLGGCRVILPDVADVRTLVEVMGEKGRNKIWDQDDYIAKPKPDGYRSHHLKSEFLGRHTDIYDGRRIELQVRTRLQHSWATAVEAVGLFRGEELKNHLGSSEWLRLFLLMSSEFAEAENCALPPGCPDKVDRRDELRDLEGTLGAVRVLETISHGVRGTDIHLAQNFRPAYYLIRYDHATKTVSVSPQNRPLIAAESYDNAESADNKSGEATQNVVLVEVDKVENLKAAYPNYFGDVNLFTSVLRQITLGTNAAEYSTPPKEPIRKWTSPDAIDPAWLKRRRFPGPSLRKKKKD